ncbi:MAG: TonB-dependent receptor, partial [Acidobacteriota bacterium]
EQSPQLNQVIPVGAQAVTLAAAREESDVDQTLSVNLNSVLSHTKVSTFRLTWTRENVAFANACFNGNGRDLSKCPPTLSFQNYIDQQDNTGQARINDGIQADETVSWFLPGKHGDHDIKGGAQYEYSGAANFNQGNRNGTFSFLLNDQPFDRSNPRTYPDRFSIRVGGPSNIYEKVHYVGAFLQDKWHFNSRLTFSLGLRYDLEVIPIPELDDPLVDKYPVDRNNLAPRLGATYDLGGGRTVLRGGYGRFFDKSHLESIGGLFTATPFTTSFTFTSPVAGPDLGPRAGALPTDPFLVNGPTINTALLAQLFPGGQLLRNTGATWDNPDRRTPYTDQATAGFERQLGRDLSVSADYVHSESRDMLMALNLNPQVRSNSNVNASTLTRIGSPTLTTATATLQQKYPGFAPFSAAVNQFVNTGRIQNDSLLLQMKKRFSRNYSAQVSYTYSDTRGNTSGNGAPASNFQVGSDMHLELNEGPTDFDLRHNFTVSGTALLPRTHGLNVSWVARALSGSPFSLTNGAVDPDLNGVQAEPLAAADYTGDGSNPAVANVNFVPYSANNYKSQRNGARGPGFFEADMRLAYRIGLSGGRRLELAADLFNLTNRTNFAIPTANQTSAQFLLLTGYSTSYTPLKLQVGARVQF